MDWVENTKQNIQELQVCREGRSVDELVRLLNTYSKLEERLVELLIDVQKSNKALRRVVVEKKSISITG